MASWCRLFIEAVRIPASRTFWTAGSSRPIRMAMIAITTNNSISVKPVRVFRWSIMRTHLSFRMMAMTTNVDSLLHRWGLLFHLRVVAFQLQVEGLLAGPGDGGQGRHREGAVPGIDVLEHLDHF